MPYTRARPHSARLMHRNERRYQTRPQNAQQLRQRAAKLNNIGINSAATCCIEDETVKQRAEKLEECNKARPPRAIGRNDQACQSRNHMPGFWSPWRMFHRDAGRQTAVRTGKQVIGKGGTGSCCWARTEPARPGWWRAARGHRKSGPHAKQHRATQSLCRLLRPGPRLPLRRRHAMHTIVRRFDVGDQRARALLADPVSRSRCGSSDRPAFRRTESAVSACCCCGWPLADFYLLDEPTNHLDIEGQEALEAN